METDTSPATLDAFSRDASLYRVVPSAVVRPKNVAEMEELVSQVTADKKAGKDVSLTARSAGTDMSGGPLSKSIVIDMLKYFNKIIEVGSDYAITEPGVYFRDFDKETKKKNLELPSYTASREINTVGGMVGNNSGGEKNLKFGKTARYVEELDVVMSDGHVHTLPSTTDPFVLDLKAQVAKLIADNKEVIEKHKPIVEKNSSGYALWDLGPDTNLARLMVGSQGTLGIITRIKFKLVHPTPFASMVVVFAKDLNDLGILVPEILNHKPDSFESYDDHTFSLAVKYFPELAAQMKIGILSLGWSFLPELWMLLHGGIPKLVLMVEFRAETQAEALAKAETLMKDIAQHKLHDQMRVAKDSAAARKYWAIRRESFNLLRKKVRGMRTAPFIDDFVVPPASLPEFLPKLTEILSEYKLTYTVAGHVGDGNFHIIPLVDPKRADLRQILDELSHKVYDLVLSYHGSISGEHNDGLVRTPFVEQMFGPEMYALFEQTKKIFDPLNIFNPGKKVGSTYKESEEHLDLPKV
jgi:FAD/FMN-containing dehydrogenase